jgi:hypothetical protein
MIMAENGILKSFTVRNCQTETTPHVEKKDLLEARLPG